VLFRSAIYYVESRKVWWRLEIQRNAGEVTEILSIVVYGSFFRRRLVGS
jgi:hypothetical protein